MINNLMGVAEVFSTIGAIALAILILLIMVTIHEFGHYIAGKIFHFKINEFSIGFGPALFKKRSQKTDELFAIRLFPLGGYCAFEGEDGDDEEEPKKKKKKKGKVADEEVVNPTATVTPAEGETVILVMPGEGASTSETIEEKGENDALFTEEVPEKKLPDPNSFTKKPCWQRIIVLLAGALMNYLLALLFIIINFTCYGQMMPAVYEVAPSETYGAEVSLHDKDILLEVEGNSIYLTTDISRVLNGKKKDEAVKFLVSRVTEWEGEGEEKKAKTREEMEVTVLLREDVTVTNSTQIDSMWGALGFAKNEEGVYLVAHSFYKFDFFRAIGRSFIYSFEIAGSIFNVLGELLTGKLGITAFGGPISTITMTSQIAVMGFQYFLEMAAYIGVNLAVFNLLPIPALDGSKIIFTIIEWIRKKPLNRKVEAIIHVCGFVFLLGFAVLVDILQFV